MAYAVVLKIRPLVLGLCLVLAGCSTETGSPSDAGSTLDGGVADAAAIEPCMVTAPTECPEPAPGYDDVEPIFQERCVPCHFGAPGGPWPLTSYTHVADWAPDIRGQLLACTMPPPDAGIPMTNQERMEILDWLRCGFPR